MPFIKDEYQQVIFKRLIGEDIDLDQEDKYSFSEQFAAAMRVENTIGSLLVRDGDLPDAVVNNVDYDPWNDMTREEKLDESFLANATYADSLNELEAVRRQSARERKDREIMSESFLAMFAAAALDPINLLPVGGVAYKTYRTGSSILKNGLATASVAVGSTAVTEAALHKTQLERTFGESAANMTAAAFLGFALGATPKAIKGMLDRTGHTPESAADDINRSMDPESAIRNGENPSMADRSVGSAQVMNDYKVRGKLARKVTKWLGFDPLSRTITSDSKATRVVANTLAENPLDMDTPLRTSVESKIKTHDGKLYESIKGNQQIFNEYKAQGGTLSKREFNEEVGKSMRSDGSYGDTYVKRAAGVWRDKLYNPLQKEFIDAELLPADIEVKTAANYLNRIWNKQKVVESMPRFIQVVSKWLGEKDAQAGRTVSEEGNKLLAREIAGRIISTPDGRLPYDYNIGENSSKARNKSALKGSFQRRLFLIRDELVEDFVENDIELLGSRYLKNTAPDLEITKEFGDVNMTRQLKEIEDDWLAKVEAEPNKKARAKLNKAKDRDIDSIAAMRDRLRGTYGQGDFNNPWVRIGRTARDLNYMRLLGGVVASSIPDVARIIAAEGIVNTFRHGLSPLIKNIRAFKVSAEDAKAYGVGTDALMGGRAEIIADVADYAQGGTAFERGVRSGAQKFSFINLMNQWTAGIKQLHAVVVQTRLIPELQRGVYDKRLGQLGISENNAKLIGKELKEHAREIDGVWVANSKNWVDQDLAMEWGAALRKESDRVIIIPGQEKPLFMSTELGKTIFQFKSFTASATQRILISKLQRQDKYQMQGLIGMVSIGALSYTFKQWDAGREISDDPMVLITEGIDRSGMLGWLMEANNTIEKISSNSLGMRPILGVDLPSSRYASRTALDSALGPTFGLVGTTIRVAGSTSDNQEWAESDTRALRRLLPGQNLSILRQGLDKLQEGIHNDNN